jgi:hypothetical protein
MNSIDKIICEVITESTGNRSVLTESALSDIKNLLRRFTKKRNKTSEDERNERKLKKKLNKEKKGKKKLRRTKQGGKTYYDYDDYQKKHRKIAKGDADSIIDVVDQEKADIAAVAREIFPNHTEEGAQSQLRKILNRERPMTKDVASKLEKMISSGQLAVK